MGMGGSGKEEEEEDRRTGVHRESRISPCQEVLDHLPC